MDDHTRNRLTNGWIDGWVNRNIDKQIDRLMDGSMDGQMTYTGVTLPWRRACSCVRCWAVFSSRDQGMTCAVWRHTIASHVPTAAGAADSWSEGLYRGPSDLRWGGGARELSRGQAVSRCELRPSYVRGTSQTGGALWDGGPGWVLVQERIVAV